MQLKTAQKMDLDFIRAWLQEEENEYQEARNLDTYHEGDRGFYCNFSIISRVFEAGELEVLRVDGKAIAFHFGEFISPGITEIHPDYRRRGYGTIIMNEILQRATKSEVCKLHVSCTSLQSKRFWPKFGFQPVVEKSEDYYKVLSHKLRTPSPTDRRVLVEFFTERDWYCKSSGGCLTRRLRFLVPLKAI